MSTNLDPNLRMILQLEGLSMALVGMAGASICSASWWQVTVFALAPELSMY